MADYVRVIVNEGASTSMEDLAPFGTRTTVDEIWESLTRGHVHSDQMLPTMTGQVVRVSHIARAFRHSMPPIA